MFLSNGVAVNIPLDTFADRTPILSDASYYPSGGAIELTGLWAAYAEIYKRQPWVNTVVSKLAMGTARLQFVVSRKTATGKVAAPESAYAQLMERPNPLLDPFTLWEWTSSTYDVYGEAIWVKLRDADGLPREIWPLHPTNVIVRRKQDGSIVYIYAAGVRNVTTLPEIPQVDIIHFKNYNPDNAQRGLSKLEPLRTTLVNDDAIRRASSAMWRNGLRPSMVLEHPKTLTPKAQENLRKQAEAKHGGVDNIGGAMVLEEGMKANVIQLSAEEMQYIDGRRLNRDEVCSAYDMPPPAVHILDKATFSNITEQMRSVYRDTQAPRLSKFESVLKHHLLPDFDKTGELAGSFELDGVLRGDFETRAAAAAPLVNAGIYKPKEARELFNLDDAGPEADKLYANAALVPLGSAIPKVPATATDGTPIPPALDPAPPADESAKPKPIANPAVRALMGAIGRKDDAGAKQALLDAHTAALSAAFARQKASVTGRDVLAVMDPDAWAADLTATLTPLATATAQAIGTRAAKHLGGKFDVDAVTVWLSNQIDMAALSISGTTAELVAQALVDEDPDAALDQVFTDGARLAQVAQVLVDGVATFAQHVAATQNAGIYSLDFAKGDTDA